MQNSTSYDSPWRKDFPAFRSFQKQDLVWLDSAATAQKPVTVIQELTQYYEHGSSNVHRAQHSLANKITAAFELARETVAAFIGANSAEQVIFTRSTTEAINLIAYALESKLPNKGNIVVSALEHHANLLPWQQLAHRKGLELRILPITPAGVIDIDIAKQLINQHTKLLSVSQMSNVFGTFQPVDSLIKIARAFDVTIVVDGAQGIIHQTTNVQNMNCDFYIFSGHKLYAPEGIGILYGKKNALQQLTHWQFGGEMVKTATYQQAQFQAPPLGFEAGTPAIGSVLGLAAAINYLNKQDRCAMHAYEEQLTQIVLKQLANRKNIHILGSPSRGIVSFYVKDIHPNDLGQLLTEQNIAVRSGQHCCMPLYNLLKLSGSTRISLACYNNMQDLNNFFIALDKALELLQ